MDANHDGIDEKRIKKIARLYYLYRAIDTKLERITKIVRHGTPIKDLLISDLPSPIADSANMKSLPHKFTFRVLQPKTHSEEPEEYKEVPCFSEKIRISKPSVAKQRISYKNYLEDFKEATAEFEERRLKFLKETAKNKKVIVDMKEIFAKTTRSNLTKKISKVEIGHLSTCR